MKYNITVEFEQEEDGRWIAEVCGFPGVMRVAHTRKDALISVLALLTAVLGEREHGDIFKREEAKP
jgi:predicted RNase H-like HicB family nuclease